MSQLVTLTYMRTSMLTLLLALYEPAKLTDAPPDSYDAAPRPRLKESDPDDLV